MSNFSLPPTRIPPCRYRDVKGVSRKPKTRQQIIDEEARAYHGNMASSVPRADVQIPMPQASDIKPGKVVYVRYTAVPEEHRPTAALRRLARGIVTSWPGDWDRGMIQVEWDYDPGELWPAEWLADAPEWV